jgi:hypothetical protein
METIAQCIKEIYYKGNPTRTTWNNGVSLTYASEAWIRGEKDKGKIQLPEIIFSD